MQYEIFSIGDPAFLAETLKATTTILNRDGLGGIVAIGFLFTFVWTIVQGVLSGGKEIKIQNIVMAGIIYAAFFGAKVDRVNVWSLYSMDLHQVEDVPLGLAFSGTVISKVGNKITEWFEQEYTVIGMTTSELGTGFALKALYQMRGLGFSDGSLKWDPNGHLTKTLDNYLKDCVVPGTTIGTRDSDGNSNGLPAINLKKVFETESAWDHLHWNNDVYTTKVYPYISAAPTPANKTKVLTCHKAYEYITEKWINNPAVIDMWMGNIGEATCNEAGHSCKAFKTASGQFDQSSFNSQFSIIRDSIMKTDVGLDKLMMNRALMHSLSKMSAQELGHGDTLIAAVTARASAQITANQALQQTMFEKMMLPLMTFFEALMYVAAPFAAILVAFGLGGIQMIGKYLIFALWIQLWKPVAAVGNMFIQMSISGEMSNLNGFAIAKGDSLASIANQPEVFDSLQHWIGVGGMLVASTPAITLMLMYGSAVTASGLAGRIDMGKGAEVGMDGFSGKSQIGDAKASLTKDTGSVALGNDQTSDATQGSVSMGAAMKNEAQQSQAIAQSETKKAEAARGQSLESVSAAGTGISERNATATTSGGDTVNSQEYSQSMTDRLVEQGAIKQSDSSMVQTGINAKASAGADFGKLMGSLQSKGVDTGKVKGAGHLGMIMKALGGKIEGGADYQDKFNQAAEETESLANVAENAWQEGESERTSWTSGFKNSDEDSITQSKEWKDSAKQSQSYQESTAKAKSAEQRASTLKSLAGTSGYNQQFEIATLSADAAGRGGMKEFGQFLEAKSNQGDSSYAGMGANVGDYRKALRTAISEGNSGDLSELMSIAGKNVEDPSPSVGVAALSKELSDSAGGAPQVEGSGPVGDQKQNQAAASLSEGVKNTLEGSGGPSDKQKEQLEAKAGRNLSSKEQKLAGQSAALSANGGISTKQEGQMREMLREAGINTTEATSGNQLAMAVSGMGENLNKGMDGQQAFDASLKESQAMADLGESVGSAGSSKSAPDAAAPITGDGTSSGSGVGGASSGSGTGGGKTPKNQNLPKESQPQQAEAAAGSGEKNKGLDFMGSEGAKAAASLLNDGTPPLSSDGNFNLDSIDASGRTEAADQWLSDHPEVNPENLTKDQAQQYLEETGQLGEGEFSGVNKDKDAIAEEKQNAMDNSDIRGVGGKGKALMDFLDTGMIQQVTERSGEGSQVGMAVGGIAGAVSAGVSAQAMKAAGKSVAMGMVRGAASGVFRGGAWGAVAGAAYGAAEGYMAYQDTVDQQTKDKAGQELKAAQGNGDFSQITNSSQEVINSTLEGVIAKQVVAMDQAAAQGDKFDAQEFRNNELDTFEQQVFDQGDALLSSGQGYADDLGSSMATAIDDGLEWRQEGREAAENVNSSLPKFGSL